jgi:hypothetical protein
MQSLGNWQSDDGYAEYVGSVDATSARASHPQERRSPLGQLIERSATSPIRPSGIEHAASGPFVGNVSWTVLTVEVDAMTKLNSLDCAVWTMTLQPTLRPFKQNSN